MATALQSSMKHATLVLYGGTAKKLGDKTKTIALDFNPKEITWARSANWHDKQTKKPEAPEYKSAVPGTLSFEAFLSYPATPDVDKAVHTLFDCVAPEKGTKDSNPRPPFVQLVWGKFHTDINVVKSVSAKL